MRYCGGRVTIAALTIVVLGQGAAPYAVARLFAASGATFVPVVASGNIDATVPTSEPGETHWPTPVEVREPDDHAALRECIADADILITDCPPKSLEAIGIDYDSLHSSHPGLVYARLGACADSNPAQTSCERDPESELAMALGITAALIRRDETGIGVLVVGDRCREAALAGAYEFFPALGRRQSLGATDGKPMPQTESESRAKDQANEILAELGYTDEEIRSLRAKAVLG